MKDDDHYPSVEFRVEVISQLKYPIFVKGSYNQLALTHTYALIHQGYGRIYALDLGKDHHNPTCFTIGRKHKHRWTDSLLAALKKEKLRSDWNTKQAVKAQVRNLIKAALTEMPGPYLQELCMLEGKIYEHVASTYDGTGKSIYDEAG